MMRSVSGFNPVISISTHTRLNSLGAVGVSGPSPVSFACDIIGFLFVLPFSHRHSMSSFAFTILFVIFLALTVAVRFWLASRHIRHVLRHRNAVPAQFSASIPLAAHQKAADYTVAR